MGTSRWAFTIAAHSMTYGQYLIDIGTMAPGNFIEMYFDSPEFLRKFVERNNGY